MAAIQEKKSLDDGNKTRDPKGEWTPRILGKAMPFAWPIQASRPTNFFLVFQAKLAGLIKRGRSYLSAAALI